MHNITERGKKPLLLPATLTCWSFNCNLNEKDSKFQWSFHSDNLDTVYFYFKKKTKQNEFLYFHLGRLSSGGANVKMALPVTRTSVCCCWDAAADAADAIAHQFSVSCHRPKVSVSCCSREVLGFFFFFLKSFKKFPFCTCARNRRSHWFRLFVKTFKFEYSS